MMSDVQYEEHPPSLLIRQSVVAFFPRDKVSAALNDAVARSPMAATVDQPRQIRDAIASTGNLRQLNLMVRISLHRTSRS